MTLTGFWRFTLALAAAVAAVLPAERASAAMNDMSLRGAGSTFSATLYKQWIETYHQEHPEVLITYDAVGSGEGVRRFVAGSVDFGASDVALSDREAAEISKGAVMVASTAGMVVLAYNVPGVRGELKLPRGVYPGILSGQIRRWDDPRIQQANPGLSLPHLDIVIVARQDSSGTTFALTNHLAAISLAWREQGLGVGKLVEWPASAMLASGNEGVASRIKISEGSIGYVEFGFAKRLGLPMALLQNKAGKFIAPDDTAGLQALAEASAKTPAGLNQSIVDPSAAAAYPIVTFSWLLLYRRYDDPQKGSAVRDFVAWGLANGQTFSQKLGYLPLPGEVSASGKQALEGVGQ
ncbi:MAG TPA: phosphate ABC transporter substrate-binding protein PstS [Stellaceae bacterium]|nr:phosphate ABC transporter substrate-binding protein PstS [Stellaceae bacterium]